jgi:pimeloyl-ACP methyl ester carboxylesterase
MNMTIVTSKDGTKIAYDKLGGGDALILVDGAMCHRTFGPMGGLAPLLAPHFTVFMYDRRGRGESGDTQPYAVEREVEDIDALIQAAGGSAYVYGVSSGAALVLEAAASGLNITRMVLWEPPLNNDETARRESREYGAQLRQLLSEGRRGDAAGLFMSFVGMPADALAGMKQSPIWPGFEAVAPTLAYDLSILSDGVVPVGRAAAVSVPTLLMTGGNTFPFMHESARLLAETMPNAQHRILPGLTHDAPADAIAPNLIEFFRS